MGAVKRMKKIYLMIFLLVLTFSLTGCKGKDAPVSEGDGKNQQQEATSADPDQAGVGEEDPDREDKNRDGSSEDVSNPAAEESIAYVNQFTGYSIDLPKSWEGKYAVEETEEKTEFLYNSQTDMKAPIFTILIYPESEWEKAKENQQLHEILIQGETVYAYLLPLDSPYSGAEAEEYGRMVGEVKEIIKSFSLD